MSRGAWLIQSFWGPEEEKEEEKDEPYAGGLEAGRTGTTDLSVEAMKGRGS